MIAAHRCGTCKHVLRAVTPQNLKGVHECHFFPPQLISVSVNTPAGMALVPAAAFPNVDPVNGFCAQFQEISTLND